MIIENMIAEDVTVNDAIVMHVAAEGRRYFVIYDTGLLSSVPVRGRSV